MSYHVVVVVPPAPADDATAWAKIEGLIDQAGPRPAVFQELHDRLTARYPCICDLPDDQVDNGVWSDGPLINNFGNKAAVLGMTYSRVDEVLPFLVETAGSLGLVVFDKQQRLIHRLTALDRRRLPMQRASRGGSSGG